ncbi:MAG: TIGR02996 domain-containing protein [Gemmataceae bacterium]|nr:TIGR02996 domain-containing protein [Gemmata sp.]MDW8198487.1 TIGR02996 domain-containing protein [Gemmataceae bacterium]
MTADRDTLLATIAAYPHDDTPRLIFADWLEENGEAERAEFIRLQCELAQLADATDASQPLFEFLCARDWVTRSSADWSRIDHGILRRLALITRSEDLLRRHPQWTPQLPKSYRLQWSGFHRGFAHRVTLGDPRRLNAARLRAAAPPVTLLASDFSATYAQRLADRGLLDWIVGLHLERIADGIHEFGQHPAATQVRSITLHYTGPEAFAALAASPRWSGLRQLSYWGSTSDTTSPLELLAQAAHLRGVRHLYLREVPCNSATLRAFLNVPFPELTTLLWEDSELDDDAAEQLANCPYLAHVRMLSLRGNQITGRGVTALLTSPYLTNVSFLDLERNPGTRVDANKLAQATPASLRMFHAHGCRFNAQDVGALARCPRLHTLWYLDLDANGLGSRAVRELIRGFQDFCPPILWLTYNRINDQGAHWLARWPAAQRLSVLHLKYNRMTDAGAVALLDSPYLQNLDGLGLSGTSEPTKARMAARFRFYNLDYS